MEMHPEGVKRLRKLMLIQGVTQRALAEAIGWKSHSYLGRILRGEIKMIDVDAAARMAHYFEISMDDLFLVRTSSDSRDSMKRRAS